ncbi:MAG: LacI family transcriptional regulator [Opitutales bacterium]|nr:LacI family transcriptional regulator [Opitutales bacterium]
MSGKSPSMKQIAAEAGVSIMTVSRVLRNQANVSAKTQQRIQDIAERLGYKPNRLVRGMQSGRSGIVSLVVPAKNHFVHGILEGAYEFFSEKDIMMSLDFVSGNMGEKAFDEQSKLINRLLESRVDGILLVPVNEEASPLYFKEIIDRKIPLVLVDRDVRRLEADFVGTDDVAGGREAAQVLAKNGCKRVVLISPGDFVSTSRKRIEGFKGGLAEFGMELVTEVVTNDFLYNGELIDAELRKYAGQFDGVFAVADRLGISAWHSCKALNLSIPDDVKIIGFGALNLRDPRVALSSFDQNPAEIGRNAAKLLFERIENGGSGQAFSPKVILNKPRFIAGTSCPSA